MLLFDRAAEIAVRSGTTIFDFCHYIGPCLTFDPQDPEEGIACEVTWFFQAMERSGLGLADIRRGNWRNVRSYATRKITSWPRRLNSGTGRGVALAVR